LEKIKAQVFGEQLRVFVIWRQAARLLTRVYSSQQPQNRGRLKQRSGRFSHKAQQVKTGHEPATGETLHWQEQREAV
jgi:hypothetical protein